MAEDQYIFGRDFISAMRLNLQHYQWKTNLGYLLSPHIARVPLTKIADVGTGTGIWLCDLAREMPLDVTFRGLDISKEQFPHSYFLPTNITLHEHNVYKDPPEEYLEYFDVVHIRLLQAAVKDGDPRPIIDNCLRILKPGGYLQWDEYDPLADQPIQFEENSGIDSLRTISQYTKTRNPADWIGKLGDIVSSMHLDVLKVERSAEETWQRQGLMENWCAMTEEAARTVADKEREGGGDSLRALTKGAIGELKQGSSYSLCFQVLVAQKPIAPVSKSGDVV